jgi:hypothetical protein
MEIFRVIGFVYLNKFDGGFHSCVPNRYNQTKFMLALLRPYLGM